MSDQILALLKEVLSKNEKGEKKEKVEKLPYANAIDFIVNGWFKASNYQLCRETFQIVDYEGYTVPDLKAELAAYIATHIKPGQFKMMGITKNDLLDIVIHLKNKTRTTVWKEKAGIFHNTENYPSKLAFDEIDKIVDVLLPDDQDVNHHLEKMRYYYILCNFFQQFRHFEILRNVHPFPVIPVFFGSEGIGKSKLLEYIGQQVAPFCARGSLHAIANPEKYYKILRDNRLMICEEMIGADKADHEAVKSNTTTNTMDIRVFHSQDIEKHRVRCVIAANTNRPTWESIRAYGKGRRWGNIFVRNDIDLKKLEKIDFKIIFKAIPLCNTEQEILRSVSLYQKYLEPYQLETQNYDQFEEWAKERHLSLNSDKKKNYFVSFRDFWKDFVKYWELKNMNFPKHFNEKYLKNRIKWFLGIDQISETDYVNGGTRGLKVDVSSYNFASLETFSNPPSLAVLRR